MSRAKVGGTVGIGGNFSMALKIQVDIDAFTKIENISTKSTAEIKNDVLRCINIFAEGSAILSGGVANVLDIDPIKINL